MAGSYWDCWGVAILVVKTFRALSGTFLVSSPHARSHHRVRLQALLVSDKQCFLSQTETKRGFPNYQVCGIAPCGGVARESCVSIIDVLKLPFALSRKYRAEYRVGALRLFGEHVQLESFVFLNNLHVFDKAHGNSFATQAFVLFEIACLLRGGCFRNQNVGRFSCVALTTKAFSASGVKWGRIILTVNQIEAWRLCHCGGVGIFRGGVELSSLLVDFVALTKMHRARAL